MEDMVGLLKTAIDKALPMVATGKYNGVRFKYNVIIR